jgi:WD40 repeat protein
MPDAELRRQRAAFYRGVARTTAIAAVVVAALGFMAVMTLKQTRLAQKFSAQAYISYVSQAQAARVSGGQGQRLEALAAIKKATTVFKDEAALRDAAISCLALVDLKERTDPFHSLAQTNLFELNPEFEISATAETGGAISLRTLNDRQLLNTLPGFGPHVEQLRFSQDGKILAAQYHDGFGDQIRVWDWRNGNRLFTVTNGICLGALDFSWDSRQLAATVSSGEVDIYSVPEGKRLLVLDLKLASGFPRTPNVLRFSPSGRLLAESCQDDPYVQLWDLCNLQWRPIKLFHPDRVYDISWHPQGRSLTTACGDHCVYLWDTNHLDKYWKKLLAHEGQVRGVAFNHRGDLIASIGLDETLRLWVPATERQVACRLGGDVFDHVRFSADDRWLVASGNPQTNARIWEVLGEEYVAVPVRAGANGKVRAIDFSPDNRLLAAVSAERMTILEADSGREMGALSFTNAHDAWFSADGRHVIASTDNGLFLCGFDELGAREQGHIEPGTLEPLTQASNELGAMALTCDRSRAAIVRQDEVRLVRFDLPYELDVRVIPVGIHYQRLGLHPHGRWLAAMMQESNSIHLWNLSEGTVLPVPSAIPGTEHFAFSPDGKWLTTCWGGVFAFYRVGAADPWHEPAFSIPRKPISDQHAAIAFTRDGATVALASSRYVIQWFRMPKSERTKPELIATLEGPDRSPIETLAFSPDGRRLAVATQDRIIQLWNLALLRERLADLKLQNNWPDYSPESGVTSASHNQQYP